MRESDLARAWRSPGTGPMPDAHDPANLPWWQAHDRLQAIADQAMTIVVQARAAYLSFRRGEDPKLELLESELDRWWWDKRSLDVVHEYRASLESQASLGIDAQTTSSTRPAPQRAADDRGWDLEPG